MQIFKKGPTLFDLIRIEQITSVFYQFLRHAILTIYSEIRVMVEFHMNENLSFNRGSKFGLQQLYSIFSAEREKVDEVVVPQTFVLLIRGRNCFIFSVNLN